MPESMSGHRSMRVGLAAMIATASLLLPREAGALELRVHVSPEELLAGGPETATVTIEVLGADAERVRWVRLASSAGSVTMPRLVEPGRWAATFVPPEQRHPRVVLVGARTDAGQAPAYGGALVRIRGRAELPLRTEPGAMVSVRVGDRSYGPARASRDGLASVPVEVRAGEEVAVAESVDVLGNRSQVEVPLELPSFPRVLLLAPPRIAAGTSTRVAALAVGDDGELSQRIHVSTTRGRLRTVSTGPAVVVHELTAPDRVGSGSVHVAATSAGATEERVEIELVVEPRPAASILLTTDRDSLVPGSRESLSVRALVRDRFGNLRPRDRVSLFLLDGASLESSEAPEGGVTAVLPAPPVEAGLGAMVLVARAGRLWATTRVHLVGGRAATARIEAPAAAVADGRTAVPVRVELVGETGLPASEVPVVRVSRGRMAQLRRDEDGAWSADFVPPRLGIGGPAHAVVEAGRGRATARARIDLGRPEPWLTLGAWGGVLANTGALIGPLGRVELAGRFRLPLGWLDVALFLGASQARVTDVLERGRSSIRIWQLSLGGGLGWGLRLGRRLGLHLLARSGGALLVVDQATTFQPNATMLDLAAVLEGAVELGLRLLLGEATLRIGYGYGPAPSESVLSGNLLGLSAMVGYRLHLL